MKSFVINPDRNRDRPVAIGDRFAAFGIVFKRMPLVDVAVRSATWRNGGAVPSRAAAGGLSRPVRGAFTAVGRPA